MATATFDSGDVRAISIFATYLSTCGLLTGFIVTDLVKQYRISRRDKPVADMTVCMIFAIFACASLWTTWSFMLEFFTVSYRAWANEHSIDLPSRPQTLQAFYHWVAELHLGSWLKDVQLFREAWEIAMETPGRLAWSQPIFFITTVWAFFIGEQVSLRRIRYGWAYMLLGQIVAISFAQCLFYMAIELYPAIEDSERPNTSNDASTDIGNNRKIYRRLLRVVTVAVVTVPVILIPNVIDTPRFLWTLAIPHIVLFLPPLVEPALGHRTSSPKTAASIQESNRWLYRSIVAVACIAEIRTLIATSTDHSTRRHLHRHSAVYENTRLGHEDTSHTPIHGVWMSLNDHPAITSVGMDSLFCFINYSTWQSSRSLYRQAKMYWSPTQRLKDEQAKNTKS